MSKGFFGGKRLAVLGLLSSVALIASAGVAQAVPPSTVFIQGTVLRYLAAPGTTNTVFVQNDPNPALFRITDTTNQVAAQFPCAPLNANIVRCPKAGLTALLVDLQDGNDRVDNQTVLPARLFGGLGNDILLGRTASESLIGGPGNDFLNGGLAADFMDGGTGIDQVNYAGRAANLSVSLNNVANDGQAGEGDNATATVENIVGGNGNDVLVGSAANNVIVGNNGNDSMFGLAGNDTINGGNGNDSGFGGVGADVCSANTEAQNSC